MICNVHRENVGILPYMVNECRWLTGGYSYYEMYFSPISAGAFPQGGCSAVTTARQSLSARNKHLARVSMYSFLIVIMVTDKSGMGSDLPRWCAAQSMSKLLVPENGDSMTVEARASHEEEKQPTFVCYISVTGRQLKWFLFGRY